MEFNNLLKAQTVSMSSFISFHMSCDFPFPIELHSRASRQALYWGYIGVYYIEDYTGIMEKKMETTI